MSRTVTVEVTAEDIERGKPRAACDCPVALAAGRVFESPHVGVFRVGDDLDLFVLGFGQMRPSEEMRRFVDDFDAGRPVAPFTFTVELP